MIYQAILPSRQFTSAARDNNNEGKNTVHPSPFHLSCYVVTGESGEQKSGFPFLLPDYAFYVNARSLEQKVWPSMPTDYPSTTVCKVSGLKTVTVFYICLWHAWKALMTHVNPRHHHHAQLGQSRTSTSCFGHRQNPASC